MNILILSLLLCVVLCDKCKAYNCSSCVGTDGCGWFASTEDYPNTPLDFECVEGEEFYPKNKEQATSYLYFKDYCPDTIGPQQAIHKRRSVRKYDTVQISKGIIEEIIGDAIWAPNCMGCQPLKWYVVQESNLLKNISDAAHAGFDIFYGGPTVIFAFTLACKGCLWFQDVDGGLAIMNLELSAYNLGLATCTVGYSRYAESTIREIVGASSDEHYVIAIVLGHAMENPTEGRNDPSIKFV